MSELAVSTSDGEIFTAPESIDQSKQRLAQAKRSLSKKRPGSNRHQKAKQRVSRLSVKSDRQYQDFQHKLSRRLTKEYRTIVIEKKAQETQQRSLSNFQLRKFLEYKAESASGEIIIVNRQERLSQDGAVRTAKNVLGAGQALRRSERENRLSLPF